jgi:hypothetical protein
LVARHGCWRRCDRAAPFTGYRYSKGATDIRQAGLGGRASDLFKLTEERGDIFWTLLTQPPVLRK